MEEPSTTAVPDKQESTTIWKVLLALWGILAVVWTSDLLREGVHRSAVGGLGLAISSGCLAFSQIRKKRSEQMVWMIIAMIVMALTVYLKRHSPRRT